MVDLVATQEDVCNLALGHIAARPITSISENSPEAVQCRTFYNVALVYVLSDYDWKFASTKKELVPVPVDNITIFQEDFDGWKNVYAMPADVAKVREILTANQVQNIDGFGFNNAEGSAFGPANDHNYYMGTPSQSYTVSRETGFGDERAPAIPFNVALIGESKYIFCDVENARARFTRVIGTAAAYEADFALMFSWFLAHLIAYPLTRKLEQKKTCEQTYLMMKNQVQANNTNEGTQIMRDPPAPWIRARGGM